MKKLLDFIDNLGEWTGRIFCWIIGLLALLVVLEVILRRLLNSPTTWNFEVTIQLYAFHFMIVGAYALLHNAHVASDILFVRFGGRGQAILTLIGYLVFFFPFFVVVLYEGILYAANSWSMHEKSWSVFGPPLYPIKTVIPLMALLLLIQGFGVFARQIYIAFKGRDLC